MAKARTSAAQPTPPPACPNCQRNDKIITVGGDPFCDRCCGFLSYFAAPGSQPKAPASTTHQPAEATPAPVRDPPPPATPPPSTTASLKYAFDLPWLTTRLEELRAACQKAGSLYGVNPKLAAAVARKAKALCTSLNALHEALAQPMAPHHAPEAGYPAAG